MLAVSPQTGNKTYDIHYIWFEVGLKLKMNRRKIMQIRRNVMQMTIGQKEGKAMVDEEAR